MDLHYNWLRPGRNGSVFISLAHYFEQNGDLCCDPDIEIRVDTANQLAEALAFQQAIPPIYQMVYPEPGKVIPAYKKSLNSFLYSWLGNCLEQDHRFIGDG